MHHILFPHWRTKKDVIWLRFPVDTHKMKFKLMITFRLFVFFSTMFFPYLTKISLTRRPKHRFLNRNNGEMKAFSCWEDATHKICNAYWFEKANTSKKNHRTYTKNLHCTMKKCTGLPIGIHTMVWWPSYNKISPHIQKKRPNTFGF